MIVKTIAKIKPAFPSEAFITTDSAMVDMGQQVTAPRGFLNPQPAHQR